MLDCAFQYRERGIRRTPATPPVLFDAAVLVGEFELSICAHA